MKIINLQLKLKAAFFILLFFLCSGSITLCFLYQNEAIHTVYRFLSLATVVFLALYYIVEQKKLLSISFFWGVELFFSFLLVSTVLNGGAVFSLVKSFITPIGMFLLLGILKSDADLRSLFIRYISNVFLLLELINLICIFLKGGFLKDNWYFLGLENQIGFSLSIFVVFFLIDFHYNKNCVKFIISLAIYILTNVIIWSASSVIAMTIILSFLLLPFVRRIVSHAKYTSLLIFIGCLLLFLVAYSFSIKSENGLIAKLTETILKKDATFSGRTDIWIEVINKASKKPLFGYGITEDSNTFQIGKTVLSAHNTFFEILYKGGIISVVILVYLGVVVSKNIDRIKDRKLASILKICLFAVSVELMSEAMFIDCLLTLYSITFLFSSAKKTTFLEYTTIKVGERINDT